MRPLADEALKAKNDLSRILEAFIAKELQPWLKTFPDDFYREIFRLRQLEYPRDTVNYPQYFGHLTNDIVYRRLAPGVLEELRRVTPRNDSGNRKHKYHQRLTSNFSAIRNYGEHLGSVVTLMKLSQDWPDFQVKLDRIYSSLRGHPVAAPRLRSPCRRRGALASPPRLCRPLRNLRPFLGRELRRSRLCHPWPRRACPSATAAGLFSGPFGAGSGAASPVAMSTIILASWFGSRGMLERFCMLRLSASG